MENNNTFKTLAYIIVGLVIVVGIVLLVSGKKSDNDNMIIGTAKVESIEVSKTETFPVGVNILAKGYLEDACTKLGDIKQSFLDNTFSVTIETKKPQKVDACAEMIQNFEENIVLSGVSGLPKGTYSIEVNGVKGAFTLGMDNFISSEDPLK